MAREDLHLSDEEMLLAADGELPPVREAQVRAHFAACWGCRSRMAEIEATIVDFTRDATDISIHNCHPLMVPARF